MTLDATVLLDPEAEERGTVRVSPGGRGERAGMRQSVWRAGAVVSLAVTAVVTVAQRHAMGPGGDAYDYIDAANHLTGPSRFPPGFPLLLAPLTGSWWAMEAMTLAIALGLVGAIWWAAVKLGDWRSGAAAGVLMLLSPGVVEGGAAVMSDRLGALLIVGALLALLYERPLLAGVLAGLSGWVRLVHVAFCAALPRRAWPTAAVTVAVLVGWQLVVKGSLLGYDSEGASFALANITGPVSLEYAGNPSAISNLSYFPAVLIGFGHSLAPLMVIPAAVGLRRWWSPAARFAVGVVLLNVVVYLPYFFQSTRFMLPAGCLLIVYAAALVGSDRGPDFGGDRQRIVRVREEREGALGSIGVPEA